MNAAAKDKKKITLTYGMFSVPMIFFIYSMHKIGFNDKNAILFIVAIVNLFVAYKRRGFIIVAFEFFLMGFIIFMSAFSFLDGVRSYGPENDLFRTVIGSVIFIACCWASSVLLRK